MNEVRYIKGTPAVEVIGEENAGRIKELRASLDPRPNVSIRKAAGGKWGAGRRLPEGQALKMIAECRRPQRILFRVEGTAAVNFVNRLVEGSAEGRRFDFLTIIEVTPASPNPF